MALKNRGTQLAQPACDPVVSNIGPTDFKTLVDQHLCDAAHACTGDADKMNPLDAAHRMQV